MVKTGTSNRGGSGLPFKTGRMRGVLKSVLAGLHRSALVLFLLGIASFHAVAEEACRGTNLLPALQQDAGAFATIEAEAAKNINGRSILWKLEKPGVAASYLMGTMHVTDPRVLAMPPAAQAARQQADTIIVESDEILDEKKAMAGLLMHPDLMNFTDGTTMSSRLSAEDAKRLEAGLAARHISLKTVDRLRPWLLSTLISMPACELARKAQGVRFLDQMIAQDAQSAGKAVVGLETLREQLDAMNAIPVDVHLKSLIEALALGDRLPDMVETMVALYLDGRIDLIMPMLSQAGGEGSAGYSDFEQTIILNRNHLMADRAAPVLARGNVFMAVGALHLPGEQGLVALLRAKGFTVTAVP